MYLVVIPNTYFIHTGSFFAGLQIVLGRVGVFAFVCLLPSSAVSLLFLLLIFL